MYANNAQKFLMSIGPQTTKEKGVYEIDHADEVRVMRIRSESSRNKGVTDL